MKNSSLKKKLFVWFTLCICIPLTLFSATFLFYETNSANQEIERYAAKQASLLAEQMNWYFRSVKYISKNYYNSEFVNDIVSSDHPRDKQSFLNDQLALLNMKKVNNYTLEDTTLQVTVITNDGTIYGTNLYRKNFNFEDMKQTQWYRQLERNPWDILWIQDSFLSNLIHDDQQERVFNIWTLKDPETYLPIGLLIIDFPLSDLCKQITDHFDARELIVIQDMYGKTVFNSDELLMAEVDPTLIVPKETRSLNGSEYYSVQAKTQQGPWTITLFTTRSAALDQYNSFYKLTALSFFIYAVLIITLMFFISKEIVSPIQSLTSTMRSAQSGNMDARISTNRHDEIGELSHTYNNLLDKIQRLMDNITLESEQKHRAEMQALSSQINPHFIINTLTSIRALIYQGANGVAEKAIRTFAALLRDVLSREEEMCTLDREIEFLNRCIEIYQMSFEYPIQITIEIDPSLYDCMIIKMITQPVLENAIMHGLKAKDGDKILSIKIIEENGIKIIISDNGIGCEKNLVFNEVNMDFGQGIGLQNVYNRIVLHHGPQYGLQFESHPGKGTSVTLRLPLIRQEGETYAKEDSGC